MPSARRLALGLCLLAACKPDAPPQPPAAQEVPAAVDPQAQIDEVFARYLASRPVGATSLGEHSYDDAWPQLGAQDLQADRERITQDLQTLDAMDPSNLSAEQQVDLALLKNALQLQRFDHEVERPWARDPFWYAGMIGRGLDDLVSRDFASLDERGQSLAGRLQALPTLVEQAKANLDPQRGMLPQTQVAVTQLDGVVGLIETVIPERMAEASEPVRDRIGAASPAAIEAIRSLQEHLRAQILPTASGTWRLGEKNFEKKLRLTLQTDITAAELRRLAVVEHGRVRGQMADLARDLAEHLFSPGQLRRIERSADGSEDIAVVAAVLEELAAWHVEPDELRDHIETTLQRLDRFVREHEIVALDDAEVLEVIWTPEHERGVFIAGLAAPGPLEEKKEGLPSFYLVQPIPQAWDRETRESFLREYNNFMLEILSIHEAIPGHFVQLYYGKRAPSRIRKALQNGAFVEGWAVYTEKVMVDHGYAGQGPQEGAARPRELSRGLWKIIEEDDLRAKAIELHALKFYLRSVTNAILDHAVHTTDMTREEALELMVSRSFQQQGEAVGKWIRAQVTSTQLSTYFVGAQAWRRLREQATARAQARGEELDLAAFHAEALSHGAPPVHMLPELMGWGDDPAPPQTATTPSADEPSDPPSAARP